MMGIVKPSDLSLSTLAKRLRPAWLYDGQVTWRWVGVTAAGTVASVLVFWVSMLCIQASARTRPVASLAQVPAYLLPGQHYPTQANCEPLHDGTFRCRVIEGQTSMLIMFSGVTASITSTTIERPERILGELVLLWGAPNGYRVRDQRLQLWWHGRSAIVYLVECGISPDNAILAIEYGAAAADWQPWHGFIGRVADCMPYPLPSSR